MDCRKAFLLLCCFVRLQGTGLETLKLEEFYSGHKQQMGLKIIDDLANLVDNTDSRIRNETRRVKLVETKSASCGMLVVIVLLLIAIVVIGVWPV